MFRDDRQINSCCTLLLGRLGMSCFWTKTGPTTAALEQLQSEGARLSSGEMTMLRVAFDFYNGGASVSLREIMQRLDDKHRRCIAELILAESRGPIEIDRWLKTWESK